MKKHGHYCKVCGEYKANEKFSGKGHAAHICKSCASLSPEKQAEEQYEMRFPPKRLEDIEDDFIE